MTGGHLANPLAVITWSKIGSGSGGERRGGLAVEFVDRQYLGDQDRGTLTTVILLNTTLLVVAASG